MGNPLSTTFTTEQKEVCLAFMVATETARQAQALITAYWEDKGVDLVAPNVKTLGHWKQNPALHPDGEILAAIEHERKAFRVTSLHGLFKKVVARIEREVDNWSPNELKNAMIALGILTDKLDPPQRGGVVANFNLQIPEGERKDPYHTWEPRLLPKGDVIDEEGNAVA